MAEGHAVSVPLPRLNTMASPAGRHGVAGTGSGALLLSSFGHVAIAAGTGHRGSSPTGVVLLNTGGSGGGGSGGMMMNSGSGEMMFARLGHGALGGRGGRPASVRMPMSWSSGQGGGGGAGSGGPSGGFSRASGGPAAALLASGGSGTLARLLGSLVDQSSPPLVVVTDGTGEAGASADISSQNVGLTVLTWVVLGLWAARRWS